MRTGLASLAVMLLASCPFGPSVAGAAAQNGSELCSPAQINLGDPIAVRIPYPTLDELAVSDPSGRWFHLQGPGALDPLESRFTEADSITLHTGTLVGTVYDDGTGVQTQVFTVPGFYEIHLADNLETEPENALYFSCRVLVLRRDIP